MDTMTHATAASPNGVTANPSPTAANTGTNQPLVKDKAAFVPNEALTDGFPPDPPFVGTVLDWGYQDGSVAAADRPSGVRRTRALVLIVRPETRAVESTDGNIRVFLNAYSEDKFGQLKPSQKNSVYGIWTELFNNVVAEILGVPGWRVSDPDQFVGKTLLFAGVARTDKLWEPLTKGRDMRPARNVTVPVGPPPSGWEAHKPSDVDRAVGIQKALERAASKQAGQSGFGPRPTLLGAGPAAVTLGNTTASFSPAIAAAPELDDDTEAKILLFLDGKDAEDMPTAVMSDTVFRNSMPKEVLKGIFDKTIPGHLIAKGALTLSPDGLYATA